MRQFAKLYERPLPSSLEAEMALLGSLILDPGCLDDVVPVLPPDGGFYSESHAAIYRSLLRVYGADRKSDPVDIVNDLRGRGELESVGGPEYIQKLASETPSSAGAPRYAKIVADKARLRRIIDAADRAMYDALNDPDADMVAARAAEAMNAAAADSGRLTETGIGSALDAVLASIEAGEAGLLSSGVGAFDLAFGGIMAVGINTIIGVPGSGKTSLATKIVTSSGLPARIFSFEMTAERLAENMLAERAQVSTSEARSRRGVIPQYQRSNLQAAKSELEAMDIAFVDDILTPQQISSRCAMYASKGVRLFMIDYAQVVAPSYVSQDERERVAEVVRICRQIVRQHKACVVLVTQPTQEAGRQDRPPLPSDGKGAQDLWGGTDLYVGVYRPAVFRPRAADDTDASWEERRRYAEIHVLKNKHGKVGFVATQFIPELTRFE